MPGNTGTCNAVIDLTGDADSEVVETSRYRALRRVKNNVNSKPKSGQSKKDDELVVTKATIQNSCPVCLRAFEKIKSAGDNFYATRCGHIFCGFSLEHR